MRKRFLVTLLTLLVMGGVTAVAVFLAKGYRVSPETGQISGTGILSITSIPDQASVYLDGHLTTATNANVNSLSPKTYDVKIVKEGFISWEKKVEVKQGLVTEVKATLFRALPSVYPLTYTGAEKVTLSPDGQKIAYVIPLQEGTNPIAAKKSGVWVWQMSQQAINFARGAEQRQVAISGSGLDYSQADYRWSPDSSQLLVSFPDRQLLLDASRLNDPPRDITAVLQSTLRSWDEDQKNKDLNRLQLIRDVNLRQIASSAAQLKWSPDESKILYAQKGSYKVVDLVSKKSYDMPQASFYAWMPDSDHLVLSEMAAQSQGGDKKQGALLPGKISIIEYDGANRAEVYAGNFDPQSVVVWPDGTRLVIVSAFQTVTASQPNLYGISLR